MSVDNQLLLFVYGTLRRGCTSGAHEEYLRNAHYIGSGRVQARLYLVRHYPALITSGDNEWVTGEIYQLPSVGALARIDDYEGCSLAYTLPHEYQRMKLRVHMDNGQPLQAWSYVYCLTHALLTPIPSGDFLSEVAAPEFSTSI